MKRVVKDILFEINEKEKLENGNFFELKLTIPSSYGWLKDIYFIIRENNENKMYSLEFEKEENSKSTFKGKIFLPTKALYNYFLSFKANEKIYNITRDHVKSDFDLSDSFKLSVNFDVPDWAQGATMYQIFVDRFARGSKEEMKPMPRRHIHQSWEEEMQIGPDNEGIWNNDFYGGDLKGIIQKLDYIQALGVDILYLCPIVFSQSTHRYDASDFEEIDPYAGTKEDLKELCKEAHKRGMHIILDAVFDHTGNDSKYYNEYNSFNTIGAYQSLDSPYAPFYRFKKDEKGSIIFKNGRPQQDFWWGQKNMPQCDCSSKEWQEYITGKDGIIDQWMALGIDGLRLDVADELSDEFIELIRKAVKRNKKDGFIIGEVWESPMRKNRGFISSGKGMDSVMSYNFISSLIKYFRYADTEDLKNKIMEMQYEYPTETMLSAMNFTSTHDITRGINLWDNNLFDLNGEWPWNLINSDHKQCQNYQLAGNLDNATKIYMAYVFALTFFPGTLSIFAGDEVGVEGLGNLNNRKPFPWNNINEELLGFFQEIGQIRKQEQFLKTAELQVKEITPEYFSYERLSDEDKMFIAISRSPNQNNIILPEEYQSPSKIYQLKKSTPHILTPYGGIAVKKGK